MVTKISAFYGSCHLIFTTVLQKRLPLIRFQLIVDKENGSKRVHRAETT